VSNATQMPQTEKDAPRLHAGRLNTAVRILVNALAPLGLYELLIHYGASDVEALAAGTAIPSIWTVVFWIWRRHVDWIGLFAVLGFAIEFTVAVFLGGSSFLLKTRGAVLTGPIGVVLLTSALIGKPLLIPILRLIRPADLVRPGVMDRLSGPEAHRKISLATAIFGLVLASHAAIGISLALVLPTETFLIASKIANWALAGIAVLVLLLLRRARPK
jgi:hypothetical protein